MWPQATDSAHHAGSEIATRLLVQAQMLMPSKNWVQQQLAIARVSVLLSSRLWSHDDEECRRRMATVLQAIRPLLSSPAPHQRAATSTRSIRVHTNTARTRSDGARSPCSLQACGMPLPAPHVARERQSSVIHG